MSNTPDQPADGPKRAPDGKWIKGVSPNPGGRPKAEHRVKELAREYTVDAITTLVEICKDAEQPPAARVAAANSILDRGYGRPAQSVDVTSDGDKMPLGVVFLPPEDASA